MSLIKNLRSNQSNNTNDIINELDEHDACINKMIKSKFV